MDANAFIAAVNTAGKETPVCIIFNDASDGIRAIYLLVDVHCGPASGTQIYPEDEANARAVADARHLPDRESRSIRFTGLCELSEDLLRYFARDIERVDSE